jgi:FO synthase
VLNQIDISKPLAPEKALALASVSDTEALTALACRSRDSQHRNVVTYSKKVFIPLTHLCRDVCHYCTFAKTPRRIASAFMTEDEVLALCEEGAKHGCQEALLTLGEKPELRYKAAREALSELGFKTTLDYVAHIAGIILNKTGMLPHINAGNMTREEIQKLRKVSASMGIMLESASARLCKKGMPHYGSPDKDPTVRLKTIELAGQEKVPFTSGILIGIGETRLERIESLLAINEVHARHGHIQEIIVQNFRAKPETKMSSAPEPDLNELLWTIAIARLIFGPNMNIQAPPNLSPGVLPKLVNAGINDWGGVSPLTPDHVNPEAPWPHLDKLARETESTGRFLEQRLTIYPDYVKEDKKWLSEELRTNVLRHSDASGFAKRDTWSPGERTDVPAIEADLLSRPHQPSKVDKTVKTLVQKSLEHGNLTIEEITHLFESRGNDFSYITKTANELRKGVNGDTVSYVVNRNINYTNVCYFKCQFCAFSKGKLSENLRGRPYDISGEEIARRCKEAWDRGATEVCMQGGIHPDYTGQTYLDIVSTVKSAVPDMHVHAFSPLEVWHGAETLNISLKEFLIRLKEVGLSTLPGTAAEILHEEIRGIICADKISTKEWLQVMEEAHGLGFSTTATIMYGHVERTTHWASHLVEIRDLQKRTGGFTEFVPLPYVHMEAPMYLKGNSRAGPSFREAILMHSIARIIFHGLIENIQASWVKMGKDGVFACLNAGANDIGGTLMNESITRAAGSGHGQEWQPNLIERDLSGMQRKPRMRTTLYKDAPRAQKKLAFRAPDLKQVENNKAGKQQRPKKLGNLVQVG